MIGLAFATLPQRAIARISAGLSFVSVASFMVVSSIISSWVKLLSPYTKHCSCQWVKSRRKSCVTHCHSVIYGGQSISPTEDEWARNVMKSVICLQFGVKGHFKYLITN